MKLLYHFTGRNQPAPQLGSDPNLLILRAENPLMAQSEPLSVKDVVSLMLKCISAPVPLLRIPLFTNARRQKSVVVGKMGGEQLTVA